MFLNHDVKNDFLKNIYYFNIFFKNNHYYNIKLTLI
jgi:hypothetical protein